MPDINQNWTMFSGKVRVVEFALRDTNQVGEPPLDLTGANIFWNASRLSTTGCYSNTSSIEKRTDNATITVTDAVNGLLQFRLEEVDTDLLLGNYHHELVVEDAVSDPLTVAIGTITISKSLN